MHLRLLAEAFLHRQPSGCAIVQLDRQAHMIEIHAVRALTLAACGDHASALRPSRRAGPAAGLIPDTAPQPAR